MCDILFASTKYRGNLTQHVGTLTDLHTFQYQEFNYKKALVKTHRVTPSAGVAALVMVLVLGVERDSWTIHLTLASRCRIGARRTGPETFTAPAHLRSLQSIHTCIAHNEHNSGQPIAHCHTTCSAQGRGKLWH